MYAYDTKFDFKKKKLFTIYEYMYRLVFDVLLYSFCLMFQFMDLWLCCVFLVSFSITLFHYIYLSIYPSIYLCIHHFFHFFFLLNFISLLAVLVFFCTNICLFVMFWKSWILIIFHSLGNPFIIWFNFLFKKFRKRKTNFSFQIK